VLSFELEKHTTTAELLTKIGVTAFCWRALSSVGNTIATSSNARNDKLFAAKSFNTLSSIALNVRKQRAS